MTFSGSYEPSDVTFLLKPVALPPTDVAEKERLIQSGRRHYSEVLAPESPPGPEYMALFDAAFERNRTRLARDLAAVASALDEQHPGVLVLVSLARAGTPIGVLLRRALRHLGREVPHYSVSIIRDRGIDTVALDAIARAHPDGALRFVDGWTGKGAIARELRGALATWRHPGGVSVDPEPVVVADLAGVAGLAASGDDYLIPSAILNAVISGLVSRTVLNDQVVGPGDFHACVHYEEMTRFDRSRWFVDAVDAEVARVLPGVAPARWTSEDRAARAATCEAFMADALERYGLADRHRLKPGIGEATRALLRRVPDRLIVADPDAADAAHLLHLAADRGVLVDVRPDMPYLAATIIRRLGGRHAKWV